MRTVFKYDIIMSDEFTIDMPIGTEVLCIQLQNNIPQLWALVDTDTDKEKQVYKFRFTGTGHHIDDSLELKYVGTVQLYNDTLVFHLFQILN